MRDFKTRFICEILNCGEEDLRILENVQYDVVDIYQRTDAVSFNGLIEEIFERGKSELIECYNELWKLLSSKPERNQKALTEISKLAPAEDVTWDINYSNSSIYLKNYDTYKKYLEEALIDIQNNMNFEFDEY